MEARAKERLTGAVVLVAIIVILVPELLSGRRQPVSPPAGSQTVTIALDGPHHLENTPGPPPAAAPADGPRVVSVRPDGAAVAIDAPAAPPATEAPSVAPPADADAPPPEPPAAPANPAPAGRAAAASAPAPAPTPRPAPAGAAVVSGWVVQLGSFASRDNAHKLVQELQKKGYSAFLAEFRGKDKVLYRVRVGPEQDRARADALKLRLGHEGYAGSVTPHP